MSSNEMPTCASWKRGGSGEMGQTQDRWKGPQAPRGLVLPPSYQYTAYQMFECLFILLFGPLCPWPAQSSSPLLG
jgi:hypothetical protein